MSAVFAPVEGVTAAIAESTDALARALPSYPAATIGTLAVGMPHAHPHPPSLIPPAPPLPLPVMGPITLGCCVSVLINGMPAARVGDIGLNPTCCGFFPMYEIFTGSSKVFIGGMRAARVMDVTMHCWPPASWMARGAVAALAAAAKAAMMAGMVASMAGQAAAIVGTAMEAADPSEANAATSSALAMSAAMQAAQMAVDMAAMVGGALIGKDPAIGSPVGALSGGHPNVLIGGFPMPSGMALAGRYIGGARGRRSRSRSGRSGVG